MRKRKTMKKALTVALAVVLLLSMFALGASAETHEEMGFCSCFYDRGAGCFTNTSELVYVVEIQCVVCKTVYSIVLNKPENDELQEYIDCGAFMYTAHYDEDANFSVYLSVDNYGYGTELYIDSFTVVPQKTDSPSDNMVGSMVTTVTAGLGGILVGIGSSIVTFFDNTVLDADGNLTTFAIWALAFLGIAFALGVVKFITFLVKRK